MSPSDWRADTPDRRSDARRAIRTWDDYDWDKYLDDVANGLGWATSESMSDADDIEVLAVTRELVRRARKR